MTETTDDDAERTPRSHAQFGDALRRVNAQLAANGEQALSFIEFVALRCCA